MANTTDIIEKLIQLALHNPSREEAASAALKAVTLIDQYQIPLGADITIVRSDAEYRPPTAEESATIEELLKGRQRPVYEGPRKATNEQDKGLLVQDNEPMTAHDAFRARLVDAWRALREERQRLQTEIHRYEKETHRKYRGDGNW